MIMSSNLLLNRRDNYLKHCSKDVTEDDISRLRNASFTPNEVFPVETLSQVQRNFIQWAHVNRDSYKPRKEHSARHEDNRDNKSQGRYFCPYHESSATSSSATSSTTSNRGRGSFSSRHFRGRVVEGSDYLVPGGHLSTFWQVWKAKNAYSRVVTILKEGYCLNFRFQPPLTNYPVIRCKYLNQEKQQFLIKAVYQMIDKKAITPVHFPGITPGHFPGI